jgi:hypothetical protein
MRGGSWRGGLGSSLGEGDRLVGIVPHGDPLAEASAALRAAFAARSA